MKMKAMSTLIALISIVSISSAAPKGAEGLMAKTCFPVCEPAPAAPAPIVKSGFPLFTSHTKAIGTVGKTGRYTIVKSSARSLVDPNLTAMFIYDAQTDSIIPLGTASGNGIAHTALSAGAPVAAAALIRPPTTRISNDLNNDSYANGGQAFSQSSSGAVSHGSTSTSKNSTVNVNNANAQNKNLNSANAKNNNSSVNVNSANATQSQGQGQDQGQWQQNSNWQQQQKNDYGSPPQN